VDSAFSWQDEAPVTGGPTPVFEVIPNVTEHSDGPIVLFESYLPDAVQRGAEAT
jgi:hypothetical protein